MEPNQEIKSETRVRMNASQNAKGLWQMEVTTEAPTVEKARELMGAALAALCEEIQMQSGVVVKAQ